MFAKCYEKLIGKHRVKGLSDFADRTAGTAVGCSGSEGFIKRRGGGEDGEAGHAGAWGVGVADNGQTFIPSAGWNGRSGQGKGEWFGEGVGLTVVGDNLVALGLLELWGCFGKRLRGEDDLRVYIMAGKRARRGVILPVGIKLNLVMGDV